MQYLNLTPVIFAPYICSPGPQGVFNVFFMCCEYIRKFTRDYHARYTNKEDTSSFTKMSLLLLIGLWWQVARREGMSTIVMLLLCVNKCQRYDFLCHYSANLVFPIFCLIAKKHKFLCELVPKYFQRTKAKNWQMGLHLTLYDLQMHNQRFLTKILAIVTSLDVVIISSNQF